jgi:glycosyltransferase involved in cell wall biosynthesis
MRILHVVPSYLPATRYGGPIYSVHGLARAQCARGDEAHVFTTNVDGDGVSDLPLRTPAELDGVRVWYFPCALGRRAYRSPEMGRALHHYAREFDVLHVHSVYLWPTSIAAKVARRLDRPYVLSPRGMLNPELIMAKSRLAKSLWINMFGRDIIARAASIHVTSEIESEDIRRLGLPARRVDVVPNGVDVPPDIPPLETERPFVLSLGRISWKKGLDRLIRSFALVPGADLVIGGNDDEGLTPKLRALVKELGLGERVTFIGPVRSEEKWRLLRAASVFALASHSENFANVVLEAMACGAPVVITPQVGLASTVESAGAGIVVEGEPSVFGAALATLLADPEARARLGSAGRSKALADFSWPVVADQMDALYHSVCET